MRVYVVNDIIGRAAAESIGPGHRGTRVSRVSVDAEAVAAKGRRHGNMVVISLYRITF